MTRRSRSAAMPIVPRVERETIRVGVVGLGWAGETHLRAYSRLPNARVVALAALEDDRVAELSAELGIAHGLRDWNELLELDDVDAVSVCTPNYLHGPVVIAALEHGKHVLCEKPLATSAAEADA